MEVNIWKFKYPKQGNQPYIEQKRITILTRKTKQKDDEVKDGTLESQGRF